MKNNSSIKKSLIILLALLGALFFNSLAFAVNKADVDQFKNSNFSIALPKNYNFTERVFAHSQVTKYLYQYDGIKHPPGEYASGSGIMVTVQSLANFPPEMLNPKDTQLFIQAERAYIANDMAIITGHSFNQDNLLVQQNSKEVIFNNNKFQKYQTQLPGAMLTEFSLIIHKKLYVIEIISVNGKNPPLTDKIITEIMSSFIVLNE